MIEREIEVFRAGRSSRGIGEAELAQVAEFDCESNPIGICFGHPKSDTPAAGTIKKLRAEGNRLFATVATLTDKAIEGIKSGEWLNRSMAFFDPTHEANPTPGKWAPRHLGLLGASAPGIPGMGSIKKALAFDADGGLVTEDDPADALIFAGAPTEAHYIFSTKETTVAEFTAEQITENARLKEEREKLKADREAFEAQQRTMFEAGNSSIVDSLVAAGKVLPAEAGDLKTVFNALDSGELEFDAGDGKKAKGTAASKLVAFINAVVPDKRVPLGDRSSPAHQFNAAGGKKSDPTQLAAQAKKLQEETPGLTFEAAIAQVSGELDE